MQYGAAANFNEVFRLSPGEYFRWQAGDYVLLPTFIERCLDVFDADGDTVSVAYPLWTVIDEHGHEVSYEGEDSTRRSMR